MSYWDGPRRVAPEDMRSMKVSARIGKTKQDRKTGAWGNRFFNRNQDPKRRGKNA